MAVKQPRLGALSDEWVERKRRSSTDTLGNSDKARRYDLCRLARAFHLVMGKPVLPGRGGDFEEAWGDLTPLCLSDENIAAVIAHLQDSKLSRATIERSLSTLRVFCSWLVLRGFLPADPFADETLRAPRGPGRPLDVAHFAGGAVEAMLEAALQVRGRSDNWPERDRTALMLGALCGLRATEISSLRVCDFDPVSNLLKLSQGTKGGHQRTVPAPQRLVDEYLLYDTGRRLRTGRPRPDDPAIIRRFKSEWIGVDRFWITRLVQRCARAAGVDTPVNATTHGLRHTFGVDLAQRNVPIPVLQQLLGHKDARTTAVYTHMHDDRVRQVLEQADWL